MSVAIEVSSEGTFPRPFGEFVLLRRIGRGGMGDVFLATRGALAGLERLIVVKTLRADYATDADYVARFIDEARTVVQLNHGNICQVHEVGRLADTYFLAMEHIAGRTLKEIVARAASQSVAIPRHVAVAIIDAVLEALDYAHRLGDPVTGEPLHLVHRDVSLANVMVNAEGEVKLIDFGLAKSRLKRSDTEPGVVMGKLAYMPPEQARGETLDGRADLYATGVMLYELVTGERYYGDMSVDEIWRTVGLGAHRPRRLDTLDPALVAILGRALAPNREQRYASCDLFRDALEALPLALRPRGATRELRELMGTLFPSDQRERQLLIADLRRIAEIVDKTERDPFGPTETLIIATRGATGSSAGAAAIVPPEPTPVPTEPPPNTEVGVAAVEPPSGRQDVVDAGRAPTMVTRVRPATLAAVPPSAGTRPDPSGRRFARAATLIALAVGAAGTGIWLTRGEAATTASGHARVGSAAAQEPALLTTALPKAAPPSRASPTPTDAAADPEPAPRVGPGVGLEPAGPAEPAPPRRRATRRPALLPPPGPSAGTSEKLDFLRQGCADLRCAARIVIPDLNKADPRTVGDFVRDVDACVDVCVKGRAR